MSDDHEEFEPSPPGQYLTQRGVRTRRRILEAARKVFETMGYEDARITDIAEQASIAHGSVYTYFNSKEDLFAAVAKEVLHAEMAAATFVPDDVLSPTDRIFATNRRYIDAFRQHRNLMTALLRLAQSHEAINDIWRMMRERGVETNTKAIAAWQSDGIAADDIKPEYAANALASMVEHVVQLSVGLDLGLDDDELARTVSVMWARSLGMHPETG